VLYIATREQFLTSKDAAASSHEINVVSTREFLWNKPTEVRHRIQKVLNEQARHKSPIAIVEKPSAPGEDTIVSVAVPNQAAIGRNYLLTLNTLARRLNIEFEKKFVDDFSNGITVYTLYSAQPVEDTLMSKFLLEAEQYAFIPAVMDSLATDSYTLLYCHLAVMFADHFVAQMSDEFMALLAATDKAPRANFHLRNMQKKLTQESVTFDRVVECIGNFFPLMTQIYEDFLNKVQHNKSVGVLDAELSQRIRRAVLNPVDHEILQSFLNFNAAIVKTNFFKSHKAAVCCELTGSFLNQTMFKPRSTDIANVFMSVGIGFHGFSAMKTKISRGGVNVLLARSVHEYNRFLGELYFFTDQMMKIMQNKNKDIPESGNGIYMVLHPDFVVRREQVVLQFIDGLLDLVVAPKKKEEGVFDGTSEKEPQYLFIGPGTNTEDLMDSATALARDRGYKYPNAFATGKSRRNGGIMHTEQSMAAEGRHVFMNGIYQQLGMDPLQVTKVITGGPDCPEALTEMRRSVEKIIAVVDRHGVLYDSKGLNKTELIALGEKGRTIADYDTSSSTTAFRITRDMKNFVCSLTNKPQDSGELYCAAFTMNPEVRADVLVLCEPRATPTGQAQVEGCMDASGKPRMKIVMEAINMAYTEDMRTELEGRGVILFKDACTNKGAVICSSLEVLAAMSFNEKEYAENMFCRDGHVPAFYTRYVEEIKNEIRVNSRNEFDLITREVADGKKTRTEVVNMTAKKVQNLELSLLNDGFWDQRPNLVQKMLEMAIPPSLVEKLGLKTIVQRVPKSYLRALFAKELASRYTYQHGLGNDEFAFHEFLNNMEGVAR
jgi:glutamate dehydrogenase